MTGRKAARKLAPQPDVDPATCLSTTDIAKRLQLSDRTVRQLLVTGKMCRFIRLGRAIRIKRKVFEKWLVQREADSLSPGVKWVSDSPKKTQRGRRPARQQAPEPDVDTSPQQAPEPDVDTSPYLTPEDIAELLQISARTVRHFLVTGKMCRYVCVGRAIRVRRGAFEEWAAQQEEDALSPGVQWIGD